MGLKNSMLTVIAIAGLAGCAADCTEAELQAKLADIGAKVQVMAANGEMKKLMEFSNRANEIGGSLNGADQDLQAACQAADEILAEL